MYINFGNPQLNYQTQVVICEVIQVKIALNDHKNQLKELFNNVFLNIDNLKPQIQINYEIIETINTYLSYFFNFLNIGNLDIFKPNIRPIIGKKQIYFNS
eukprot:TRINITY_DN27313_c0_g1_i1.p4 TRINITY_DN27313_c0_g1~~TRINITY_DN27313_c0_g1_i1.p4  ORF type:complete len:100 (-),score=14.00 TRINITY_DN27313_c0_g1_i1:269-568(-)